MQETEAAASADMWSQLKSTIASFCVKYGIRIVAAIAVLIVGMLLVKLLFRCLSKSKWLNKIDKNARSYIRSALKILLYSAVLIIVIGILGIPMASIAAIIASCGVAIGLALQGSLSNLAGGIMLLIFKPFKVDDYVKAGEYEGTVTELGIFNTALTTLDNRRVVLPNSTISNCTIVNATYYDERMVDLTFCVDCDAPIDVVAEVLHKTAEADPFRLEGREIVSRFKSFGDSCANYQLRVWCKTEDYWSMYYSLLDGGKRALTEAGIKIPYPIVEIKPSDDRDYRKA